MKFLLISPKNRTIYNFRGDLVKEINSLGYEIYATGPNYDHIEKIESLGVKFEKIDLNKTGINFWSDLKYTFLLWLFIRKIKPDVVLGYTIKPVIYGSLAAKLAGCKNVYCLITGIGYTFTSESLKARLIKIFVTILYRIAFLIPNKVIFQNRDDLSEFLKLKLLKNEQCELVNGSGVNLQQFNPKPYPENITFLMISRVLYSKGVLEYLSAAKQVKKDFPKTRFILLGSVETSVDSIPESLIQEYVTSNVIEYFPETNDVRDYIELCSVYVLPSYREGTPRTVLEAMAMGRPVITTDSPGCRETVENEVNGFLVPVKNSNELAQRMNWFNENQYMIPVMGNESLRIVKNKFDVKIVNSEMIQHMNLRGNL
jgi:glycosyltransferase involved in cell wall biosynthesis